VKYSITPWYLIDENEFFGWRPYYINVIGKIKHICFDLKMCFFKNVVNCLVKLLFDF
jgi:hypothetical protein